MKKFFPILCIIGLPLMLSAQQKTNPQQQQEQLRREMDAMRMEMQQKIQALQDSLAKLQQQLAEQQQSFPGDKHYKIYVPDGQDYYFMNPDSNTWDHSFNFSFPQDWNMMIPPLPDVPPVEPFEYHFNMPDIDLYKALPYQYQYRYEMPRVPDVPRAPYFYKEKKHKHDEFLKGLPFYEWFKS